MMQLHKQLQQAVLIVTTDDHLQSALEVINQAQAAREKPELPATHPSLQWINTAAESLKIETVRELITSLSYGHATKQYYCLLHAELLTLPAQHALLKSLEEPPPNVTIILVSTAQELLLETLRSRCQIIEKRGERTAATAANESAGAEMRELLPELAHLRYGQLLDRAEQYKDGAQVQEALLQLLELLESGRHLATSKVASPSALVQAEQVVLHHLRLIAANCNARLVFEQCLFQLKTILQTRNKA